MPEVNVTIGQRSFQLACEPGEEANLTAAAQLLNIEAEKLHASGNRITESRMLLMAGLMLADKTMESEWDANATSERIKALETQLRATESKLASMQSAAPKAFPEAETLEAYEKAVSVLESLADQLEA